LDKDARIPDALFALGAAVVEVGGITARPQEGNPKPRVWRVPSLEGMVNCYGLNSQGADAVARRLRARVRKFATAHGVSEEDVLSGKAGVPAGSLQPGKLLCVQIAKNKETPEDEAVEDYVYCAERLARYADVVVVNVSSPNTEGLRELQSGKKLQRLLYKVVSAVQAEGNNIGRVPKVMVKVSPDEDSDNQIKDVVNAVWNSGADGIIVGNTTKRKLDCVPQHMPLSNKERGILAMTDGGYSGPAMFERTVDLVRRYRKYLDVPTFKERKTVFATGGITNGEQAFKMAQAGADLSMVNTALVYGGAGTVTRIKEEMRNEVHKGKDGE
jgi:dihydroorotate dehydrogenase